MIPTITPEWLTDRLRKHGALTTGHVTGILPGTAGCDALLPFQVLYSPDTPASAPPSLLVKTNLKGDHYGRVEVRLYRDILENEPDPPVPPTFDIGLDESTGHSYLLQQDLTDTHHPAVNDDHPPTIESLGAIIDQIARVHALCWNRPMIEEPCFLSPRQDITDMCLAGSRENLHASITPIIDRKLQTIFKSSELDPALKETCEAAMHAWPDLYTDRISEGNLTLIHGDLHPWNVFVPNDGGGPPLIFDWELFCRGLGVYDVSYLIIRCRLPPQARQRFEEALIPRYHDRVTDLGVDGYSLETCRRDYRLSIIPNILPPLAWQRPHNLISTMEAFRDWECADLFDGA